ncbi:MAG: hemin receptor [Alphaproteobacteria bacterium]|nr:hemin receptor [Alphaproteobacteria bacterium]
MTPEETKRVQETFKRLEADMDHVAAVFYERLFALDPSLRDLFRGDLEEQGRKLMTMLKMLTKAIDELYAIMPAIENLAFQHVRYHVKPADYDTFGKALIEMLELELGADCTPEVKAAWQQAYTEISSLMKEAAKDVVW